LKEPLVVMKQILLSCDTEVGELAQDLDEAFALFVLGMIDGEQVGVPLINAIAEEYGAIVNHFVDVYHPSHEKNFAALCEQILTDGHFVGLHTHPRSRFGRRYMYEYDEDEQMEILTWGKEWLFKHLGLDVKTHRAGGYGADERTCAALRATGFTQDSSFFYQAKECRLDYPFVNKVSLHNSIWEFPVTVYRERRVLFGQERKPQYKKLDFRYGSDAATIIDVVRRSPDNSISVLFLHSFNFLIGYYKKKEKKFSDIGINRKLIEEYRTLLAGLSRIENLVFVDFSRVLVDVAQPESVGEVERKISICQVLQNRWQTNILGKVAF
jgi:hypothetical protein